MKINIFAHAAGREPGELCPAGEAALGVFQPPKVIHDKVRCPTGRLDFWLQQRQLATAQRAPVEQQFNSNLTALLGALLAALTHPGRRQRVRHRVVEMGSADLSSPLWGNFGKSGTCTLLAENRRLVLLLHRSLLSLSFVWVFLQCPVI